MIVSHIHLLFLEVTCSSDRRLLVVQEGWAEGLIDSCWAATHSCFFRCWYFRIMDNPSIYFHAYMHIPDFQNQSLGLSSTQDLQFLISEPPSSLWGCIFFLFTLLAPTFSLAAVGEKGVERTPVRIFMISLPSSKNINFKAWVIKEWPDSVWSCQGSVPFISSDGHFSSLRSIYYGSG